MTEQTNTRRTRSRKAPAEATPAPEVAVVEAETPVVEEVEEETAGQRWGVLVRGRVYYLGEKVFERGKPKPVTVGEEDYLNEHAVDEVTVEDEFEHQPRKKFRFADSLEELEVPQGSPPARRARR